MTPLSDLDIEKYSRQILLPSIGQHGQRALSEAKVLVVGVGGLGCPVSLYLASTGVGRLGLIDFDSIELSNLPRQILFSITDIGLNKATTAFKKLQYIHPHTIFDVYDMALDNTNISNIVSKYDIIVDCTDNFETRYLIDNECKIQQKPLVYASIFKNEGQLTVFHLHPLFTLHHLYPKASTQIPTCTQAGVLAVHTGLLGLMQANEVIKIILKSNHSISGKILSYNFDTNQQYIFNFPSLAHFNTNKKETINQIDIEPDTNKKTFLTISLQDFLEIQTENTILIDVRTKAEFMDNNIGGLCIPSQQIDSIITFLESKNVVYLYCNTSSRSREVAQIVSNKYDNIEIFIIVN